MNANGISLFNRQIAEEAVRTASTVGPIIPTFSVNPDGGCSCRNGRLCPDIGKHPLYKDYLSKGLSNREEIFAVYEQLPFRANYAILTGSRFGIVVVDLDVNHERGINGFESIANFEKLSGVTLPKTWINHTGTGCHFIFSNPISESIPSVIGILPGIDIKADGGYVIGPGSLHRSLRRYFWDERMNPTKTRCEKIPPQMAEFIRRRSLEIGRSDQYSGTHSSNKRTFTLDFSIKLPADLLRALRGGK